MQIVFLIIYLVGMFAIGVYFKGRIKGTVDFYVSSRSLPWPVIMLTFAATWIGASSTMARSGLAYDVGLSAMTLTFSAVAALYVFAFISPKIRRIGSKYNISSIPELYMKRFGKTPALIAAVIIVWTLTATVGSQMVATSKILEIICEPWGMSYEFAAIISVIVIIGYTMLSGLYGVAYTDVVQGLILLTTVGIVLPCLAISQAGGWTGLQANLPADFFSFKPDMRLIGFMWVYLLYFLSGPPYWQRAFASSSERGATKGIFSATTIILLYTFMVTFVGMAAAVIYPSFPEGISHESLIPIMVNKLFHPVFSAVVMAALMAVLMSTIDSYLINAAQTLVSDIYKVIKEDMTDLEQLRLAKWAVGVLGIAALIVTFKIRIILEALVFAFSFFAASLSAPTLATLYWRKATKEGVTAGILTGLSVAVIWQKILHKPYGLHPAIPGGILCLLVLIIVSLATYNPEKEVPFFE